MATGWANEGAVQEQIDSTIEDAVQRARSRPISGSRDERGCPQDLQWIAMHVNEFHHFSCNLLLPPIILLSQRLTPSSLKL